MVQLFVVAFALLFTQQPDDLSIIEGKVLDKATGQSIAGARVIAVRIDKGTGLGPGVLETKPAEGEQDPQANQVAVLTGADGKFKLRFQGPVACGLFVDAEGYTKPQIGIGILRIFRARPGSPKTDVVLQLTREVSISGRVLDADTEQPVPGLSVTALVKHVAGPGSYQMPLGSGKTDAQGRFKIERMAAYDYYLQVAPPLMAGLSKVQTLDEFRNDAEKTYARSWYPNVSRFEDAMPVKVVDGAPVEDIEIRVAKRKTASIRGRVFGDAAGGPPADVTLTLIGVERRITGQSVSSIAGGKLKAGDEFEIDRLNPCTCYLIAETAGDNPKYALMSLAIGDENQEGLNLSLRPTASLNGHVRMEGRDQRADQPALPTDAMTISLRAVYLVSGLYVGRPAPVSAQDGSFSIGGLLPQKYYVSVAGAPPGYAISEVRYNSKVWPFGLVPVEPTAEKQELEVRLAPTGSVLATITDGDKPLPKSILLLAPEAADPEVLFPNYALQQATANQDGKAAINGLLPGAYRVIAYQPGALWADDADFQQRLMRGQRVEVTASQQAVVELRPRPAR